jgi:predicted nucleic-acid-binding Zn-ribbon protein
MKNGEKPCPKCSGQMEAGEVQGAAWVSVSPEARGWQRAKRILTSSRLIKGLRCTTCGYLELYVR